MMSGLVASSEADIRSTLRRFPIIQAIRSRADFARIAEQALRKRFGEGDIIYTPGPVREIALIVSGTVGVRFEAEVETHQLNVGSVMGEMEFFSPSPNAAWLVALGPVELVCIAHADLRQVVDDNPCTGMQIYQGFLEASVKKLRDVTASFLDLSHRNDARHLAHDLRSPLAALRSLSATLSTLPPDDRETLQIILERIDSIAESTAKRSLPPAQGAPREWLQALIREKRAQYADEDVRFTMIDGGHFAAFGGEFDAPPLIRVLANLLDNSVEASDFQGEVTVMLLEARNILRIDITDGGLGMDQRVLDLLGMRPVTHGKENGQGIGLFQAFRVVEGMGGQLILCSSPGKGMVASLRLYADAP